MNIIFYTIFFFLYITNFKKTDVGCAKIYDFKKIKNIHSFNLLHEEFKKKKTSNFNHVFYQKRNFLHIRIPKKIKELNLYSNDIQNAKISKFIENKKKNKLYYLNIHNNNNKFVIKKKKKNNNRVLELFFEKKKLLKRYMHNLKSSLLYKYKNTKIITRTFLASSLIITALNILGLKPEDIALHSKRIIRSFEFYRIITSALFYGDISLYVLTNIYMLYTQSQDLEKFLGSSETLSFYLSQIIVLSFICSYLKKPFYSTAILKSLLFLNCMFNPYQKSQLIFGIYIYNIYLPYLSILIDILHAQSLKASLSGVLGVTSGSIYYFLNIYLHEKFNIKIFKIPNSLKNYLDSLNSEELL
ncbi:DER1-like protein, putative [Plasmodium relictum]|uniref:Derlin n=1 Tax=Plasmodium relictum TaxID=85471 RepID=A0A1J1H917_PLARL|nr:DER1-like protein, putative [Plasmodium relictum]CRH01403.1 DER1-like protein, putative [Plasmodium relictum]